MSFLYVRVDEKLIEQAKIESTRRMDFGFRGQNTDIQYKFNMIFISCIGELAFQKYLDSKSIKYSFADPNLPGREVIIDSKKIEIKTSGYDIDFTRLNLIYNTAQYAQSADKGIDYVLQIFINGYKQNTYDFDETQCDKAVLAGFIDFDLIGKYPVEQNRRRPNHKIPLDNLNDIAKLL
jgi:hypothetical protein